MEAATGQPWIPLTNWPHCKKRLESEIYENLPMLEEAFQQTEVENDKNLVICQKSADTQKHYKSLPKITSVEMEKKIHNSVLASIHSINYEISRKITCIDLRTKEIMYLTTKGRFLELPHFA